MKFLMVWALVLMADFILEFRFEYLWPFWLLMRSVYDSFKFQGLVSCDPLRVKKFCMLICLKLTAKAYVFPTEKNSVLLVLLHYTQ